MSSGGSWREGLDDDNELDSVCTLYGPIKEYAFEKKRSCHLQENVKKIVIKLKKFKFIKLKVIIKLSHVGLQKDRS